MDGKIFEADVGSCIRSVPGLKPSQHEIDEIKAYMDRGGTCDAMNNIYMSPWWIKIPFRRVSNGQWCDLYILHIGTLKIMFCVPLFPNKITTMSVISEL